MKKIIALILSVFSMGMYAAIDGIPLRANANALIKAAERGDSDGCEKLIDAGVDVNCGLMAKPIHGAARNGHEDCVRFLISKGALVGGDFPAPLSSAAQCKQVSVMRILLEHGARPDNDYQYPAKIARDVYTRIKEIFGKKVFKAAIPQNVKLSEAQSHGKAIFDYDFKCKGAVAYMKLAREIIKKGEL